MQIDQIITDRIYETLRQYLGGTVKDASDAKVILTESLLIKGVNSVIDNIHYRSEV